MTGFVVGLASVLFGHFYGLVFPLATIACMAYATAGHTSLPWAALRCLLLMPLLLVVFAPVHIEPMGPACWWLPHLAEFLGDQSWEVRHQAPHDFETLKASLLICFTLTGLVLYHRAASRSATRPMENP